MVVKLTQKPEMQISVSKRASRAIFRNRLFSRLSTSPFVRFSDVVVPIQEIAVIGMSPVPCMHADLVGTLRLSQIFLQFSSTFA